MFIAMTFAEGAKAFVNSRAFQIIIVATLACFSAQVYKFVYYSIKYKKLQWYMLPSTGGFPSSHTTFVVSLTLLLGLLQMYDNGTLDWSFAVAFVFTIITVHDAMGVRYEASKHAIILNNMVINLSEEEREDLGFGKKGRLKEKLGHRGVEVLGGVLFGIIFAIIGFFIIR